MKLKYKIQFVMFIMLAISACKKDEHNNMATLTSITINSPYENQVVNKGDTLNITASIKAPAAMHGYDLFIVSSNNDTLLVLDEHTHGDNIVVNKSWVNTTDAISDAQLIIVATLDHDGNTLTQSRTFKISL
ncbi:MAG: hypothetical protein JST82_14220 [Bacteroidetes bacterium]|nr:hypothetical protein [Bacteroidota bacterium]